MMNKLKQNIGMAVVAFGLLAMPMAPIVFLVGCSGGCSTVAEGHDAVVVRAEQTADLSFEAMDSFVSLEENNRAYLRSISPEIEKAANRIRVEGKSALESLRDATKAYKNNRTPENKANVDTWLAVVIELRKLASKHLKTAKP